MYITYCIMLRLSHPKKHNRPLCGNNIGPRMRQPTDPQEVGLIARSDAERRWCNGDSSQDAPCSS